MENTPLLTFSRMRRRKFLLSGLLVVAVTGCIQGDLDLPEFHLTDVTGELPDPTLVTLTQGTSVSSTSVSGTTDDTSSSGEESSTGELPASVCDPQPDEIETEVIVDGKLGALIDPIELRTPCLVTWVGTLDGLLHFGLACEDGPHFLDVTPIGDTALHTGDVVELGLSIQVPQEQPWANLHVVIRRDGEVMLAAASAERLPDGPGLPAWDFFAPLDLFTLDDVCDIEMPTPCTVDRRQALAFIDDGEVELVYDRGSGQLGDVAIEVGSAIEHVDVTCADVADAWYAFVAVRGE